MSEVKVELHKDSIEAEYVNFEDVDISAAFTFRDNVFIRTTAGSTTYNALLVDENGLYPSFIADTDKVCLSDVEITLIVKEL